jgi:hypothetical protein
VTEPPGGAAARNTQHRLTGAFAVKRLHVHIAVENLDDNIRFYTALFQTEPSVREAD